MSSSIDGSESVDQFLARIAGTPQGSREETRRMDEEFLKGRQERQARRLERARSISPSKTGPAKTASIDLTSSSSFAKKALDPPVDFSASSPALSRSNATTGRISPTKEYENSLPERGSAPSPSPVADSKPFASASGLARSGTLSWQQRPDSKDGTRTRPLSGSTTARLTSPEPAKPETQAEPSRAEIAASLAQKDPTWFRQTQDRGQSSAAYRKSQVEESTTVPTARTAQLPGMKPSREPSKSPAPEMTTATRDADRFRRGTTPDIVALRNSMTETPAYLRNAVSDLTSNATSTAETSAAADMPPPLARASSSITQNRSPSPTKGLGGFVESAMMKRSDSVSKRWSVRGNTGLVRGDSVAGPRPLSLHGRGISRDMSSSRANSPSSPLNSSRPVSSHGRDIAPGTAATGTTTTSEPIKPENPASPKPKDATPESERPQTPSQDSTLARSPSKTMDPRRWSPTKSTWLESALSQKQEPPKIQPLKEEQPQWKVDLQRKRSMRASRDVSPEKTNIETTALTPVATKQVADAPTATNRTTAFPGWSSPKPSLDASPQGSNDPPVSQQESEVKQEERSEKPPSQNSQRESVKSVTGSNQGPPLKPKPQTPPKTDFRASLKSRAQAQDRSGAEEPEFKSMFGKLKRTTTQNYVAPDELKNNITSGKAALNVTGGPVKTKRVDEFKESILAKKEEMRNAPSRAGSHPESKPKPDAAVPEALARRKTLSKANAPNIASLAAKPQGTSLHSRDASMPESDAVATTKPVSSDLSSSAQPIKPRAGPQSDQMAPPQSAPLSKAQTLPSSLKDASGNISGVSSAKSLSQHTVGAPESSSGTIGNTTPAPSISKSASISTSSASSTVTRGQQILPPTAAKANVPMGGKLAARLNPNLAAMLSRGPTARNDSDSNAPASAASEPTALKQDKNTAADQESLTHITKARAKGPKRRAPKADTPSDKPVATGSATIATSSATTKSEATNDTRSHSRDVLSSKEPEPSSPPQNVERSSLNSVVPKVTSHSTESATPQAKVLAAAPATPKSKPEIVGKSPQLRKISGSNTPSIGASSSSLSSTSTPTVQGFKKPVAAKVVVQDSQVKENPVEPKNVTRIPLRPFGQKPLAGTQVAQGLGLDINPSPQSRFTNPDLGQRALTPPPDTSRNPIPSTGGREIRAVLESYVGSISHESDRADFDAQQFLMNSKPNIEKSKTTKYTIQEITGDGRKSPMPSQQDYILYEDSMYLIVHNFALDNGQSQAEVYLWCGDRVSDAAIEDAQVFCRRDAREHNTKLIICKQGREPGNLLQALGGILIIRGNKTSQQFMLCGRKHIGHIVFDEVEFSPASLCPGFTFLVSATNSRSYLWKGKGASVDEVGSAKLIAMDLGLVGEIAEIEQGQETVDFWQILGGKAEVAWSDNWSRRSSMRGLPTTMYRVDHERAGMLTNLASWGLKRATSPAKQPTKAKCEMIRPFVQSDLETNAVHIVDAYTALYVVVTRHCTAKAAEFVTALYIAQDLSMLSPAVQDRPVVPTCHVVAGTIPADVKACFRKWSELEGASLTGQDSICVRLEEVMEALEL